MISHNVLNKQGKNLLAPKIVSRQMLGWLRPYLPQKKSYPLDHSNVELNWNLEFILRTSSLFYVWENRDQEGLVDFFSYWQLVGSEARTQAFNLVHCVFLEKARIQQFVPFQGLEQIKELVMSLNYKLHQDRYPLVFLIAESPDSSRV